MSESIRRYPRRTLTALLHHTLSFTVAVIFVIPLTWAVAFSLRQTGLPPPSRIEWIPSPVVWSNYARIFQLAPLGMYAVNSLVVIALAVPITLIVASSAGFAMALLPERVRRPLVTATVILLMAPVASLWLTRFILYKHLHLFDTVWALVAPSLMGSSPFFVLLFYWTFRRVPLELFESARLDGANALSIWARIAMPLARPTIVTVAVLCFSMYWSDFISPLLYLKSEARYTLPVGLQLLQQLDRTNWPLLMASAVVLTAPIMLVFLTTQRFFWQEGRLSGMSGR
jgi:multiple sugar transport system permease protein